MKVISGSLKGRKIIGHNIKGTRPTINRVKESIFGMIQNNIKEKIVLDLFAGTGSLGIESISNYAKKVYFVDNNIISINTIKKNLNNVDKGKYELINSDYLSALKNINENKLKFDIIFLDPPYDKNLISNVLEYISSHNILNDNGIIICEHENEVLKKEFPLFKVYKEKKYGRVKITMYK